MLLLNTGDLHFWEVFDEMNVGPVMAPDLRATLRSVRQHLPNVRVEGLTDSFCETLQPSVCDAFEVWCQERGTVELAAS
jgi:hypothetical protein